jgi:hypothetical protein
MELQLTNLLTIPELKTALESGDHVALAKHLGKASCGFTDEDLVRMNVFWDAA